jgi:6-pyruvoyltetrahydropterin/6-carboxytetrahydropterin synthase
MFEICKEFTFSAAHSVYSQHLLSKWTDNTYPKCRRLPGHGHNYKILIYLQSEKLDKSQMVTDFGHLKWFKKFVDKFLDHKLIVSMKDEAFLFLLEKVEILKEGMLQIPEIGNAKTKAKLLAVRKDYDVEEREFHSIPLSIMKEIYHFITFSDFQPSKYVKENVQIDFYQRFFDGIAFFRESPTSENLSKFIFNFVNSRIKELNIKCKKVSIYETETSFASYHN